jgi:hypothetical protein
MSALGDREPVGQGARHRLDWIDSVDRRLCRFGLGWPSADASIDRFNVGFGAQSGPQARHEPFRSSRHRARRHGHSGPGRRPMR